MTILNKSHLRCAVLNVHRYILDHYFSLSLFWWTWEKCFCFTPLHNQNADFVGSFPKGRARGCRLRISNAQWCKTRGFNKGGPSAPEQRFRIRRPKGAQWTKLFATHQPNIFSDFHFMLVHSFSLYIFWWTREKQFFVFEQWIWTKEGLRPPNKGFE